MRLLPPSPTTSTTLVSAFTEAVIGRVRRARGPEAEGDGDEDEADGCGHDWSPATVRATPSGRRVVLCSGLRRALAA